MQNRRQFLRQSFAFSALASLGGLPSFGAPKPPAKDADHLIMAGDWGYENTKAQMAVARAMGTYTQQHALHPEALLMLGDNWYGPLDGGVESLRWKTSFEDAYPASVFPGPVYAIPGNHDYQVMPESKLAAELAYAKRPGTRWTMPSLWYRVELPATNPIITLIALDSNVPHAKPLKLPTSPSPRRSTKNRSPGWMLSSRSRSKLRFLSSWVITPSTPTESTAITPFSSRTGSHSCGNTTFISISPDTTTISSISNSPITPPVFSCRAAAEPIFTD